MVDWLLIIAIVFMLTLLTRLTRVAKVDPKFNASEDRWIVVSPMWGLCNRLRTLRVAHDLAKALNRKLAVVDNTNDNEFKSMFDGRLRDLFSSPFVTFLDAMPVTSTSNSTQFTYNGGDCSLTTSLTEMSAVTMKYLVIKACGLTVDGLTETNEFYKSLVPTTTVIQRMSLALAQIGPTTVGVHIRQGNISDYRKGNFFGAWKKDKDPNKLPTKCCTESNAVNQLCPDNAPHIEKFIEAMNKFNASKFFVCSDRPGCYKVLHDTFAERIISNPVEIEYDAKALNAFCDWYCLANCSQIIVTSISSFSTEAAKMNNAKVIAI